MTEDQPWSAAWDEGVGALFTPPAEAGWSVQVDYVARLRDGTETAWSSTGYSPTTDITVTPSVPVGLALDQGAVALLIARVVVTDPDGWVSKRSLGGRVVILDGGGWSRSETEWTGGSSRGPRATRTTASTSTTRRR